MDLISANLDIFYEKFNVLEELFFRIHSRNSSLEQTVNDSKRVLEQSETRKTDLLRERLSLLSSLKQLQQNVTTMEKIKGEKEQLQKDLEEMKMEYNRKAQEADDELLRHVVEMRTAADLHQRELEAVRIQSRSEVEEAKAQAAQRMKDQESETKQQLEEMKRKLWEQDKEHRGEILKLRVQFGADMARVQNAAEMSRLQLQQQQQTPDLYQNFYRNKLWFFQEEKRKEVAALQQRIRELEEGHVTFQKQQRIRELEEGHVTFQKQQRIRELEEGHVTFQKQQRIRELEEGHVTFQKQQRIRELEEGHVTYPKHLHDVEEAPLTKTKRRKVSFNI